MIEGLCNQSKLSNDSDKLELRYMDELFDIEKHIGEVVGVIGLQFNYEQETINEDDIEYEKFEDEVEEE